VRCKEDCSICSDAFQRTPQDAFGAGVLVCGGFVEEEKARVS
jgi:hypothetical protein